MAVCLKHGRVSDELEDSTNAEVGVESSLLRVGEQRGSSLLAAPV